jgi:hypothetical protein
MRKAALAIRDDGWMKPGTRSWRQVTAGALALLGEADPYRLDPGMPEGAPEDEYAPEANAITRHLLSHRVIELKHVDAMWHDRFGEPLSKVTGAESADNRVARLNHLIR